jgi:nucleotide-binding universal stress UspA family protein
MSGDVFGLLKEAGEKILADAKARVERDGIAVESRVFDSFGGRLCDRVVEQVQAWSADLLVLGTHGRRGPRRVLLGSDAEQILRIATVPVLLVRLPAAVRTS